MRRRFRSGQIESQHGSSHAGKSVQASVDYIEEQFSDYLKYGSLSVDWLSGKRILELGFGDNLGVSLKFLAAGAEQVVCIDKFYSQRDPVHERAIYAALRASLAQKEKYAFDEAMDLREGIAPNAIKLKCINGLSLERAVEELVELQRPFDLVVSRAVIEEIYEPDQLFSVVDRVLVGGGYMLHKIDLSDYGMFSESGMHPLTFLTIPNRIYRLMASDSGIPNRKRIGYYRSQLERLGYKAKVFITSILGKGKLDPHQENVELSEDQAAFIGDLIAQVRPRLDYAFKNLPDEDLMIEGIFLVAQKPDGSPGNTSRAI